MSSRTSHRRVQIALDDLEHGSVVLDSRGNAWQLAHGYWYRALGDDSFTTSYHLAPLYPFKTIYAAPKYTGLPIINRPFPPQEEK